MDPASVIAIVSDVIGIVDVGVRLFSEIRETFQSASGLTVRHEELLGFSERLLAAGNNLRDKIIAGDRESEKPLLDLAQRCSAEGTKLRKAIEDLQTPSKPTTSRTESGIKRAAESVASAARSRWNDSDIRGTMENLTKLQSEMMFRMIMCIWEESRQDSQRHNEIKGQLDVIARSLQEQPSQKRNNTIAHTVWELDWNALASNPSIKSQSESLPTIVRILDKLAFQEMRTREEAIPKNHEKTFEWIWEDRQKDADDSDDKEMSKLEWPGFPRWLSQGEEPLYRIKGKPGSGKSTFMKYIFQHPYLQTLRSIDDCDLLVVKAGFFFFNPGNGKQKSLEGLLRSLLFQCLSIRTDLVPVVFRRRWALYNIVPNQDMDLSLQELKEAFSLLCSQNGKTIRLLFFIDGLDEFEGAESSPEDLLGLINGTIKQCNVKFCVASREWKVFDDAFPLVTPLTMQKLTFRDIQRFVQQEFDNSYPFQELKLAFPKAADKLIKDILDKADGVFLWVNIVVRTLKTYMTTGVSMQDLEETVHRLPKDINDLYTSIWKSIPKERRQKGSKLFQLYRVQMSGTTLETFWLAYEGFAVRKHLKLDQNLRQNLPAIMKRVIDACTRGILEVVDSRVGLVHRSAEDWMRNEQNWREICSESPPKFDAMLEFLDSYLIVAPTGGSPSFLAPDPGRLALFLVMTNAFRRVHNAVFLDSQIGVNKSSKSDVSGEENFVQTIDNLNGLGYRLLEAGSGSGKLCRQTSVLSSLDFTGSGWPNLVLGENMTHIEFSFVGIAASAGFSEYVKVKVNADRGLLILKRGRVSLLENAIFPDLGTVWDSDCSDADYLPALRKTTKQRLEVIRFLLEEYGDTKVKTAYGGSMYNAVSEAKKGKMPGKLDTPEWYDQVLKLLRGHGYTATDEEVRKGLMYYIPQEKGEMVHVCSCPPRSAAPDRGMKGKALSRLSLRQMLGASTGLFKRQK
ncbi:hypothetical protein QBC35DRAFT_510262 [Podospora australis]|uniref:Nephrocystin 3-like N-terminal domain-containing protein n=1 Tax=Podospora australis TaxID=1536484 RepID=A0AAN6WIA2_9PEZI|nr:hypothetical protein QBC35DRAFT_510262 [Podospora australis]